MRIFLVLFVVLVVAGCGADNPIRSGHTGAPSRVTLDTDEQPDGDTADLDLMPTGFENPLSSFDFNTLDGGLDLEPDEVLDPEGADPADPADDTDTDGDDDLEPEVVPDDNPDSGGEPDSDDDPDPDDGLEPEVVDGDGDPDSGAGGDVDDFGIEVVD